MYVGMALEFKQLPLLAEGLAQAAVHHDMYYPEFLRVAEAYARIDNGEPIALSNCVDECLRNSVITTCSTVDVHFQFKDGMWKVEKEMVRDYVCKKAFHELAQVCSRYRVDPDDLDRATAELINTTGTTSAKPSHRLSPSSLCFFHFHTIRLTPIFIQSGSRPVHSFPLTNVAMIFF